MVATLVQWLLSLLKEMAKFGQWLTTPLPYVGLAPLAVFSFTGLTIIIGVLLVRLFIGG